MVDWNSPLINARSGAEVWLTSVRDDTSIGRIIVVQDSRGSLREFLPDGTPHGHINFIANCHRHKHAVRTRLARMVQLRANDLIQAENAAIEDNELWGMF